METLHTTYNNIEDRSIRIFISSTFSDMQSERDALIKKVFPRLSSVAEKRDVRIVPLDLRWGVTEEMAKEGKVIATCLNEIDHSRPFFIGLLGDRYGTCMTKREADTNTALLKEYPWLRKDMENGLSITEIEIQYGVLRNPETIDAFFYLKESDGSYADNPEKLNRLKKELLENGRYRTETYSSVEELAAKVEKAFMTVLDRLFPDEPQSEMQKERRNQQAFIRSKRVAYIPDRKAHEALDAFIDGSGTCMVVAGESGIGKSTLIANWIAPMLQDSGYKVVFHSVGNGNISSSYQSIVQLLCEEIRDLYGLTTEKDLQTTKDEGDGALESVFEEIAGKEPLLIVLDGIDQIEEEENAKQLLWLPIPPTNVKFLFCTTESDSTMSVFRMRHYPVHLLLPLSEPQRMELVNRYLKEYGKALSPQQAERIVKDPQNSNTLVLRIMLDELIGFGSHELLDRRISYYLKAESTEEFFQCVLQRMEDEIGEQVVGDILSLVAFGRHGLSENEIMDALQLDAYGWSLFLSVFRQYFMVRSGLLALSNKFMLNACQKRYAPKEEDARRRIISVLQDSDRDNVWSEAAFQYAALKDYDELYTLLLHPLTFVTLYYSDKFQLGKYWNVLLSADKQKYAPNSYAEEIAAYCKEAEEEEDSGWYYDIIGTFFSEVVLDLDSAISITQRGLEERKRTYGEENSDTASSYNNIGLVYSSLGDYPKALEYFEKSLETSKKLFGEEHPDTARAYNNIGTIHDSLGDYTKALEYYEKSLETYRKLFGEKHSDTATAYNNIGWVYNSLGDYPKALEYFEKGLETYRKLFGEEHPNTALAYNNIGAVYDSLGDYTKALEYFEKSLETSKKLFGEEHPNTARAYSNIGLVYNSLGDYTKALEYFEKSLETYRKLFGEEHPNTVGAYNNIGLVYNSLGGYTKALEYFEKSLETYRKLFGEEHPNTVGAYNNIGNVYNSLGGYTKALEYFEKGLETSNKLFGEEHPNTARAYNNIGNVYNSLGDYPKALEYYEKSLETYRKLFGEEHPDTARGYNNMGSVYQSLGDYPKALEYYEKSLETYRKLFGEEHPDTVGAYNNIGKVYQSLGDYPKALEYFEKGLETYRKLFGEEHPNTALAYNNIGNVYNSLGDYPKALEYYEKSLETYRKLFGEEHPDTVGAYNNIGLVYNSLGDYPKALEYFEKSLETSKKLFGEEHPDTAMAYNNIGMVYQSLGDYTKALEYFEISLEIKQKLFGKEHPTIAGTCNNIGLVYNSLGNYSKALEYLEESLETSKKLFGAEHPDTVRAYNSLGMTYHSSGDYPKALEHFEKGLETSKKLYGEEHPETAKAYNNIGAIYLSLGTDYPKALEYSEKSIGIKRKIYGDEHPETASTYNNIGLIYKSLGDYTKALNILEKSLYIKQKIYGENHPYILSPCIEIMKIYHIQKDYTKAKEYSKMIRRIARAIWWNRLNSFFRKIFRLFGR